MSKTKDLLDRIKSGNTTWSDYSKFLELDVNDLEPFFNLANKITLQNFENQLKIYTPNKRFPAISITGSECALGCEHCDKKYLKGMKPLQNNADLENYLTELSKNNGVGALISGGCDPDGAVPLIGFLDTVKKVKDQTNLIINVHTGLLNEETAKKLAEANVDIISFDINMDNEVIKDIYHLNKELDDYKRAVSLLKKYNLNIVPHICVGLYYGRLHKELESIKFLKEINPSLIVLIALIPPKSSKEYKKTKFETPKPIDIAKIVATIRFLSPKTEISLGCMRPRKNLKIEIEKYAVRAGITRIENPSKKTINWVKKRNPEVKFKFYSSCCAIPKKFEKFSESSEKEIKRYLNN